MTATSTPAPRGNLLREPLLWFALLGALIFLAEGWFNTDAPKQIVITNAIEQRMADQWQGQMGRAPSAEELTGLTEQWIKEEIYAREAAAMGLDQNDTIIRRRLVQKLTFLTEDIATAAEPEEAALAAYYNEHIERYREPARFDFEHRYFSSDRRNDALADATAALQTLAKDDAAQIGDAFMLQLRFANRSERQIGDLFGRDFAAGLVKLESGSWQGPLRSAYGQHLVRVTATSASAVQPLAQVRTRVLADYAQQRREQANTAFYEGLREQYVIERGVPETNGQSKP
ncbi:MAG: peptidyl-prolyl cis-trans isomerase [Pseudomonadales bacterium]